MINKQEIFKKIKKELKDIKKELEELKISLKQKQHVFRLHELEKRVRNIETTIK